MEIKWSQKEISPHLLAADHFKDACSSKIPQ